MAPPGKDSLLTRSALLALALVCPAAMAQPTGAEDPPKLSELFQAQEDPRPLYDNWTLRFEPAVWFVAPAGEFNLPGEPAGTRTTFFRELNLDSPRPSLMGEFHLRTSDIWRFSFSGFSLEEQHRGAIAERDGFIGPHPYSRGDRLEGSVTLASGEFLAGWRLPLELGKRLADFEGRIELLGGARFLHLDLDVEAPSGSLTVEEFFVEPVVGIKLNMEVTRQFTIDVQSTFGHFSSGGDKRIYSWDIITGFMWYPLENVGVQLGYRQLLYDLLSGPRGERFEYRGAAAGVYGGITVRF
jgi:hypothetical protein